MHHPHHPLSQFIHTHALMANHSTSETSPCFSCLIRTSAIKRLLSHCAGCVKCRGGFGRIILSQLPMNQSDNAPPPPTERGSVYFLGSCSRVPYLQKQVALLPCWINISARRSNNRDSCPSKEEGVQLCSTGPVRPRRSLKDLSLPASGDKHAGQCHASCSLACLSRRL